MDRLFSCLPVTDRTIAKTPQSHVSVVGIVGAVVGIAGGQRVGHGTDRQKP